MENDRGYDGESRRNSSLSRCGVERRGREGWSKEVKNVEEARERRGRAVKVNPQALISNIGSLH